MQIAAVKTLMQPAYSSVRELTKAWNWSNKRHQVLKADQYVSVRHVGGEVIIDETLRELEEEFPDLFTRVHRNALVHGPYC